jgi:hypothetical protein
MILEKKDNIKIRVNIPINLTKREKNKIILLKYRTTILTSTHFPDVRKMVTMSGLSKKINNEHDNHKK